MNEPDLVVVCVVTWNGGEAALQCLASVLAQTYPNSSTVVVDNNSRPEERGALHAWVAAHRNVEMLANPANVGLAAAANQGLEYAWTLGARWMLLVTQDTILEPDTLTQLVQAVRDGERIAMAGPLVMDQGSGAVLSMGECVNPWLLAFPRRVLRYRHVRSPYQPVRGLVGCCLLLATEVVRELGGFCEKLFAYYEEVDLCLRVHSAGYRVAIVPGARVRHEGWRGYLAGATATSAFLKARNLLLLCRMHLRPWHWLLVGPSMAALYLASMLGFFLRGEWHLLTAMSSGIWMGVRVQGGAPQLWSNGGE